MPIRVKGEPYRQMAIRVKGGREEDGGKEGEEAKETEEKPDAEQKEGE